MIFGNGLLAVWFRVEPGNFQPMLHDFIPGRHSRSIGRSGKLTRVERLKSLVGARVGGCLAANETNEVGERELRATDEL